MITMAKIYIKKPRQRFEDINKDEKVANKHGKVSDKLFIKKQNL